MWLHVPLHIKLSKRNPPLLFWEQQTAVEVQIEGLGKKSAGGRGLSEAVRYIEGLWKNKTNVLSEADDETWLRNAPPSAEGQFSLLHINELHTISSIMVYM